MRQVTLRGILAGEENNRQLFRPDWVTFWHAHVHTLHTHKTCLANGSWIEYSYSSYCKLFIYAYKILSQISESSKTKKKRKKNILVNYRICPSRSSYSIPNCSWRLSRTPVASPARIPAAAPRGARPQLELQQPQAAAQLVASKHCLVAAELPRRRCQRARR